MSKSALKPLESLVGEIKTLIAQSRQQVAVTVNAAMTMLYWQRELCHSRSLQAGIHAVDV